MVSALRLQVRDNGLSWTHRERKLLEVLVLRICAHVNYRLIQSPLRIRQSQVDSIYLLMNHHFQFENPIELEEAENFCAHLKADLENTLAMCDMASLEVILVVVSEDVQQHEGAGGRL